MPNGIGFTLSEIIIKTSNRLRAIANNFVFRESGITGSQFCILRLLSKKNNQNPTEILKVIGGTKSNLSQRMKSLEKIKLISRASFKPGDDRRNIYFRLTPRGQKLVANLMRRFKKASRKLEKKFSKKEIETHFAFFQKMNNLIDKNKKKLPQILKD